MECTLWNTADVESARQFDYYRSGLCESFAHLTPHRPEWNEGFAATVEHWRGDGLEYTFLASSAHLVSRSKRDIAIAEDDDFYLNFIQYGEMHLDQFGAAHRLRPGELVVIDNAFPFEADIAARKGHRHVALRLDRRKFACDAPEMTQRLRKHELANALRQALGYLCRTSPAGDPLQQQSVAVAIDNLVATIVLDRVTPGHPLRAAATLERVKAVIAMRYDDSRLSLDEVAETLHMSRRSVQHHLQVLGCSFTTLLADARLEAAHRMLTDTERRTCVEEICFACGFGELSTFYRAFKNRFGIPPARMRGQISG